MKKNKIYVNNFSFRRAVVVICAVLTMTAVTVTTFASEEISGWVKSIFQTYHGELSSEQGDYLSVNEKVILQSKTVDGWTFELNSAITDGDVGYIVVDLKAPEGISTQYCQFANFSGGPDKMDFLIWPAYMSKYQTYGCVVVDDGDGRDDTKRFVMFLDPDEEETDIDPFGPEAEYQIHLENITRSDNTSNDLIVQGVWDFTVTFAEEEDAPQQTVELLAEPVTVTGYFLDFSNPEMAAKEGPVVLTSVEVRNLTVTFHYDSCEGIPEFGLHKEDSVRYPVVVLKDGSTIELMSYGTNDLPYQTLVAKAPIVLEQVDYIRMVDGTIIPMPDITE